MNIFDPAAPRKDLGKLSMRFGPWSRSPGEGWRLEIFPDSWSMQTGECGRHGVRAVVALKDGKFAQAFHLSVLNG